MPDLPNPIPTNYEDVESSIYDAFPVEMGRLFCKLGKSGSFSKTRGKGNKVLERLDKVSVKSIRKIQDKRDHVIAMACVLDYNHNWFSKGYDLKYGIEERDEYLEPIPDRDLVSILLKMSNYFISKTPYLRRGGAHLKIGEANEFLKSIDFK